jgi:predicted glycosyltransferase
MINSVNAYKSRPERRDFQATARRIAPVGKIWIDIDNSPHVPFFVPIIEELRKQGAEVILTARNMYQVCELLEFFHVPCKVIGGHCGKNTLLKVVYNCARAVQLSPTAVHPRPNLALSHGSRAQVLICKALGIPTVMMHDYEHSIKTGFLEPDWFLVPDVIPDTAMSKKAEKVLKYRGLKEDVYIPRFRPDRTLFHDLGISGDDLIVTLRPPATEAHYHCPETDRMFEETVRRLASKPYVQLVVLPRNSKQNQSLQRDWPDLIASRRMVIPERPVDGLNLIWFSDLVISGGGTMNREAAALGVPVYSIFRGKLGAVDKYLAEQGRMTLIENSQDVHTKILLSRWARPGYPETHSRVALTGIVDNILTIMGGINQQPLPQKQRAAVNGHR